MQASGKELREGSLPQNRIDAAFQTYLNSLSMETETLTNSDTLVFTKPVGILTTNDNRSFTSISGVPDDSIANLIYNGTGTINFASVGSGVVVKEPTKVGNYYAVRIQNIGTQASPSYIISDAMPLVLSEIVAQINAATTDANRIDYDNLKNKPATGSGTILKESLLVLSADVLTGFTTSKEILAAQGANVIAKCVHATATVDYNSAAYATNTTLQLRAGTTVIGECDILGVTADSSKAFTMTDGVTWPKNANINVMVKTGNPTAGDSDIGVAIEYVNEDETDFGFPGYASPSNRAIINFSRYSPTSEDNPNTNSEYVNNTLSGASSPPPAISDLVDISNVATGISFTITTDFSNKSEASSKTTNVNYATAGTGLFTIKQFNACYKVSNANANAMTLSGFSANQNVTIRATGGQDGYGALGRLIYGATRDDWNSNAADQADFAEIQVQADGNGDIIGLWIDNVSYTGEVIVTGLEIEW